MNRDAGDAHAISQSILHGIHSPKRRQKCGMDIQNPVAVGPNKSGAQNPHEPCQDDRLNPTGFEKCQESLFIAPPGGIIARTEHNRFNACTLGPIQGKGTLSI